MQRKRKIVISGNWREDGPENEWAGTGTVDEHGAVECSADLGDDAYDQIEQQIADGEADGKACVTVDGRNVCYHWTIED